MLISTALLFFYPGAYWGSANSRLGVAWSQMIRGHLAWCAHCTDENTEALCVSVALGESLLRLFLVPSSFLLRQKHLLYTGPPLQVRALPHAHTVALTAHLSACD